MSTPEQPKDYEVKPEPKKTPCLPCQRARSAFKQGRIADGLRELFNKVSGKP